VTVSVTSAPYGLSVTGELTESPGQHAAKCDVPEAHGDSIPGAVRREKIKVEYPERPRLTSVATP
jgi:hypothetical protein